MSSNIQCSLINSVKLVILNKSNDQFCTLNVCLFKFYTKKHIRAKLMQSINNQEFPLITFLFVLFCSDESKICFYTKWCIMNKNKILVLPQHHYTKCNQIYTHNPIILGGRKLCFIITNQWVSSEKPKFTIYQSHDVKDVVFSVEYKLENKRTWFPVLNISWNINA